MPFTLDHGIDAGLDQTEGAGPVSAAFQYYSVGEPTVDLTTCAPANVIAGSQQDLFVPVRLTDAATDLPLDPTGEAVSFAFTHGADPSDEDFVDGAWLTHPSDGAFYAAISVATLAPAAWIVFVRAGGYLGRAGLFRVS